MKVKIVSEIGENCFELRESAIFSLLSTALTLQNGGTAVATPDSTYVSDDEKKVEPVKTVSANAMKPRSRVDSMFGSDWKKGDSKKPEDKADEPTLYDEIGYKGFLIIRCEHCGEVKGFCSKSPITEYKCGKCENRTRLKGLKKAFIRCECGSNYKYQTNISDEQFTYECLNCGSPVELQYNSRKNVYKTM